MPSLPPDSLPELQLRTLQAQLERMRGMHYGYYVQFFQAAHLFTVLSLLNLAASLYHPLRAAVFVLPFFIVYAGFFCAYLLSYNLFARIYATALEKRLNALLGGDLLVAHRMEEVYLYATPGPKFVAVDLRRPWTFISASTFSFTVGGGLMYALAAFRAWQLLPEFAPRYAPLHAYWPLLLVWTLGHLAYILWFFVGGKPERDIAAIVGAAYPEPTQGTR